MELPPDAIYYGHFYGHLRLFAPIHSRSWKSGQLDFWLVGAKNRPMTNTRERQRTSRRRTHKPLVAGSNPAAATIFPVRTPNLGRRRGA
jgi:hypothetical protein